MRIINYNYDLLWIRLLWQASWLVLTDDTRSQVRRVRQFHYAQPLRMALKELKFWTNKWKDSHKKSLKRDKTTRCSQYRRNERSVAKYLMYNANIAACVRRTASLVARPSLPDGHRHAYEMKRFVSWTPKYHNENFWWKCYVFEFVSS